MHITQLLGQTKETQIKLKYTLAGYMYVFSLKAQKFSLRGVFHLHHRLSLRLCPKPALRAEQISFTLAMPQHSASCFFV